MVHSRWSHLLTSVASPMLCRLSLPRPKQDTTMPKAEKAPAKKAASKKAAPKKEKKEVSQVKPTL